MWYMVRSDYCRIESPSCFMCDVTYLIDVENSSINFHDDTATDVPVLFLYTFMRHSNKKQLNQLVYYYLETYDQRHSMFVHIYKMPSSLSLHHVGALIDAYFFKFIWFINEVDVHVCTFYFHLSALLSVLHLMAKNVFFKYKHLMDFIPLDSLI